MFKAIGSLNPHGAPVLRKAILVNSGAFVENDMLVTTLGFAGLGVAATLVFGHLNGIVDANGVAPLTTGVAGAATGSYAGAYTVASDNQTVAKVSGLVDVSKASLYSADPDATIGTTLGSNLLGYLTDLADEDNTDEDAVIGATAQMLIWGVDPADSGNQVVNIYESRVFGV